MKEFEQVNLDSQTKTKLEFISKITNIAQSRILAEIINCVFALAVNYDKASFQCFDSQLDQSVTVRLIGYSKLQIGHFKTPENATDTDCEKMTEERMQARIKADLAKDAGKKESGSLD